MNLTGKQKKHLRALAHKLSPLVQVGKHGKSAALIKETSRSLEDHELVKVAIGSDDRDELRQVAEDLAAETRADLVQLIGKIAVLYKPNPKEPKIKLPRPSLS